MRGHIETSERYRSVRTLGKEMGYEIYTCQMQYDLNNKETDKKKSMLHILWRERSSKMSKVSSILGSLAIYRFALLGSPGNLQILSFLLLKAQKTLLLSSLLLLGPGTNFPGLVNDCHLGVTPVTILILTNDLRWNTHVSNVCTKAKRAIGFLRRNLYDCPQKVEEASYHIKDWCAQSWNIAVLFGTPRV